MKVFNTKIVQKHYASRITLLVGLQFSDIRTRQLFQFFNLNLSYKLMSNQALVLISFMRAEGSLIPGSRPLYPRTVIFHARSQLEDVKDPITIQGLEVVGCVLNRSSTTSS